VPQAQVADVLDALKTALGKIVVGDPRLEEVRMGPLASLGQRREVREQLAKLEREAEIVYGVGREGELVGADAEKGAFMSPTLLLCRDTSSAREIHSVEAFGPVLHGGFPTAMSTRQLALARRGGGSLVSSVFTASDAVAAQLVLGLAPFHGRVLVVDRQCAKEVHRARVAVTAPGAWGPGRAGGGEELGGIRGVLHYMQRTAVQGTPSVIAAVTGRWVKGAPQLDPGVHPFRKPFGALRIGIPSIPASAKSRLRTSSASPSLSGDKFYCAHGRGGCPAQPFVWRTCCTRVFPGGPQLPALFVDPPYGPVLANYGIGTALRFTKPVKPGDRI